jgi:hypothetical protein
MRRQRRTRMAGNQGCGAWSNDKMSIAERDTVRQAEQSFIVPLSPFQPGMADGFLPAQVTIWPAGVTLTGSARIRANGWVDVEVARPPSMAGLKSYPEHRISGIEWLPESWEPETGADGCQS